MSQQIGQNWSKMIMNGEEWNRIAEKVKTHRVVEPTGEHGSLKTTIIYCNMLKILRRFVKERFMSPSKCFGPPKLLNYICS